MRPWLLCAAALLAGRALGAQITSDPFAKPGTRLGPGFALSLAVSIKGIDEPELCGRFPLDDKGRLSLTVGRKALDKIALAGTTIEQARGIICEAVRRYFVTTPEVRAAIAYVPRIQVVLQGATFRNGPLTLWRDARLSDAIAEAGYMPDADLERVRIARIEENGTRVSLTANLASVLQGGTADQHADPVLRQADCITLDLKPTRPVEETIAVYGEVKRPGFFTFVPGMAVCDALTLAQGLLPTADPEQVTLVRPRGRSSTVVNAESALRRIAVDNLEMKPGDVLFVAARDLGRRYVISGRVAAPSTLDLKGKVTLKSLILAAGGLRPDADRRRIVVLRGMLQDPTHAQVQEIDYDRIATGQRPDVPLDPGDAVQVPARRRQTFSLFDLGLTLLRFLVF